MNKHFDHKTAQAKWNQVWEERGIFPPDDDSDRESFVIILPPPNVTGVLHVGHILGDTIQDMLIRWKRMCGFNTLWLPGADHAGIATQKVVEDALLKRGLRRSEMPRDEFVAHAWEWTDKHHVRIVEQMKNLGCAFDWSREAFTLDEPRSRAVREAFVRLYEKGLIYRGSYIVNWCPSCQTAISDEEVDYREKNGKLYWIRYPIDGGGDVVVATTRPETMLGDTAVAVSPDDTEKRAMVGKTVALPIVGRKIPVVADEAVDKDFGSGYVKVTPAHDPNDYAIGVRHELPSVVVIDRDGKMTADAGADYAGLDRFAARRKVIEALEAQGLIVKIEPYTHSVGHHDRCDTVIEPLLSRQWFVSMKQLATPAVDVVERGEITFYPERWHNVYMSWMTNIRDWCISRQLWWGHRIPVWYCSACDHLTVARLDPTTCEGCGAGALRQDEDVLDTWFSSWLWTFSPMGWPDEDAPDLKRYHPTSVLVTGSEIIFFWVARMIMASLEFMGEVPFRHVFLTGIVRDGKGRKMSKSLGNSPDPLDVIDKWGTDAFRFTLAMLSPPGKDVFFEEDKIELGRNFVNKLWQAARMITAAADECDDELFSDTGEATDGFARVWHQAHGGGLAFTPELSWEDRWILSALERCASETDRSMSEWRLNEGVTRTYDFFWHDFCDWYLELAKIRLYGDGDKRTVVCVLIYTMAEALKLLHPVIPYATEEIWDALPATRGLVMENPYPKPGAGMADAEADAQMTLFQAVVTSTRNIRAEYAVTPGKRIPLRVRAPETRLEAFDEMRAGIVQLARIDSAALDIGPAVEKEKGSATTPIGDVEVIVPLAGMVDLQEELERLDKEKQKIEKDLEQVTRKLSNDNFVNKANPDVVAQQREKQTRLQMERDKLIESMSIIRAN